MRPGRRPGRGDGAGRKRIPPGLVLHRFQLGPDEVTVCGGIPVTTAVRTAYDLGRRPDRTEVVVALDALARGRFSLEELRAFASAHRGGRGSVRLRDAVAVADPRSGSPMESRIRMAIHRHRLPLPQLQFPVGPFLLDLAYPEIRLAVEYDGREHRTPERARRDLEREAYLTRQGWDVLRLDARTVFTPGAVAIRVHRELVARGAARPTPVGPPLW